MYDPTSRYLHVPESRRSFGSPRRHQDRSLIWSASLTTPDPSHVGDPDVESQSQSVLSQSSTVASYACKCKLYIAELQVRFECSAVSRPLICSLACTDQAAGPGSERSPGRKKISNRSSSRTKQVSAQPNLCVSLGVVAASQRIRPHLPRNIYSLSLQPINCLPSYQIASPRSDGWIASGARKEWVLV